MERLDIAIIGTGPAGLSAAINAKIRNKSFKIFGTKELSTKLVKAHQINNYVGFPAISGKDLKENFEKHLEQMGIEITEEKINNIYNMGDYFALLANENQYEATSVVIATGVNFSRPYKGELELLGKGVGYCATCDGALYKDKVVTLVVFNKHEEAEVNFMAELASKVYLIPMYKEEVSVSDNVEIIKDTVLEVVGESQVEKVVLKNGEIVTDGLFILRDSLPPSQLLDGLELDGNHVKVDRSMATNIPGVFAAGDIVGAPYQYIKGAGEGNIAGLSAVSYVDVQSRK